MSVRRCSWSLSGIDLALVAAGNLRLTVGVDSDGTRHAGGWPGGRATSRRVVRACIARSLLRGPPHPPPTHTPALGIPVPAPLASVVGRRCRLRSIVVLPPQPVGRSLRLSSSPVSFTPLPLPAVSSVDSKISLVSVDAGRLAGRAAENVDDDDVVGAVYGNGLWLWSRRPPSPGKGNGTERRAPRPPSL